ncbi:hypothetical protein [Cellulophaga tyrosinoxydans]|uniref:Uncharacterized protein n=1 Tax=Cellulophaga tyrosinoxydans TaxID=504486 RepID=A0A1W2BZX5_9FLAO|nr:hypothetical protein [Cellulophaga tyrosinoxydans]SMC78545.1 hypothetical protein SAMN05660703_2733 [Cellulophaga tyrosinoxydans]
MKIHVKIFILLIVLIFIGSVIYEMNFNNIPGIPIEDKIDLKVEKIKLQKGIIFINDSLYLVGNTYLFEGEARRKKLNFKPRFSLYDMKSPYQIIKKTNNDTLTIIQGYDTLFFKFYNEESIDTNDLTIKQYFEKLFKS